MLHLGTGANSGELTILASSLAFLTLICAHLLCRIPAHSPSWQTWTLSPAEYDVLRELVLLGSHPLLLMGYSLVDLLLGTFTPMARISVLFGSKKWKFLGTNVPWNESCTFFPTHSLYDLIILHVPYIAQGSETERVVAAMKWLEAQTGYKKGKGVSEWVSEWVSV